MVILFGTELFSIVQLLGACFMQIVGFYTQFWPTDGRAGGFFQVLEGSGNIRHHQGLNRQQLIGGFHYSCFLSLGVIVAGSTSLFSLNFHYVSSYFNHYSPIFHDVSPFVAMVFIILHFVKSRSPFFHPFFPCFPHLPGPATQGFFQVWTCLTPGRPRRVRPQRPSRLCGVVVWRIWRRGRPGVVGRSAEYVALQQINIDPGR